MKVSTLLLSVALAAESLALGDAERAHVREMKELRKQKRQGPLGLMTTMLGKGGKVSGSWLTPTRVPLTPIAGVPGAKKTKMRYGPYSVIGMEKTSILGEGGALWNYPDTSVSKPESSEFTIFGMQAGLEYLDGSDANIDTGLWLHHMVQFNIGYGREDATCSGFPSLPHVDVGTTPGSSERMFSSGNERTYADLTRNGAVNVGYNVKSGDYWALIVDLMNMNMEDKTVYMTITYDYVDGFPASWDNLKPVWFDANQCGTSEVSAVRNTGSYQIESRKWTANFDGEVVGLGSHLHDGGINLQIFNNGKLICDSKATYGGSNKYVTPARLRMGPEKPAINHISNMGQCYGRELKSQGLDRLKKGDQWQIRATYDYDKAPGNVNAMGNQEEVMAISIMYVRVPHNGVTLDHWAGGGASAANPSMGATGASIFSNMATNLGLGSLFGGGSSSSSKGSSGMSGMSGMKGMLGM